VVDRGGLDVKSFQALMQQLGLVHFAEFPDVLFSMLDEAANSRCASALTRVRAGQDHNGRISLKEIVDGFAAFSPSVQPWQRLRWVFQKFDHSGDGWLELHEMQKMVQFLCILQSMQHEMEAHPTVWQVLPPCECAQSFPASLCRLNAGTPSVAGLRSTLQRMCRSLSIAMLTSKAERWLSRSFLRDGR